MYGCNKNVCSHAHKTTRDSFHTQTPTHANSYTKTHTGNYDSALSSSYRWCFGSGPQISQLGHYKQPKGMHLNSPHWQTSVLSQLKCLLKVSLLYLHAKEKQLVFYFFLEWRLLLEDSLHFWWHLQNWERQASARTYPIWAKAEYPYGYSNFSKLTSKKFT